MAGQTRAWMKAHLKDNHIQMEHIPQDILTDKT